MKTDSRSGKAGTPMRVTSRLNGMTAVMLAASILGACGSDASTTSAAGITTTSAITTTSSLPAESTTVPAVSVEEFAQLIQISLSDLQEGFGEVVDAFFESPTAGPDRIQLEADLARMQVTLVDEVTAGLPPLPDDDQLAGLYEEMTGAMSRWGEAADQTADGLEAAEPELAEGWDTGESAPQFNAIFEPLPMARDAFERACLDLAEPLLESTAVALDCLGVPESEPVVEALSGNLGGVDVELDEGAELVLVQETADKIVVSSEENDELAFVISRNPSFADPTAGLDLLRVEGGTDWPDDMEGWIESVGGTIENSGDARVGSFSAEYWDVSITEDRANELSSGHPAVAVIGLGGDGPDIVQFQDVAIMRLFRIPIDPSSSLFAFAGGVNPASPAAGDIPPFIPRIDEVTEWLDASLPAIDLF